MSKKSAMCSGQARLTGYCMLSIIHFMAFPNTITGEGPIVETAEETSEQIIAGTRRVWQEGWAQV
jgi:hypothetical protein